MSKRKQIWIIASTGPIEGENWRDYLTNLMGKYLSQNSDCDVVWWTSNYSHHFKKYRSHGWKDISINDHFVTRLVPTTSYKRNFGIGRLLSILVYSLNTGRRMKQEDRADLVIGNSVLTLGYPVFSYGRRFDVPIIVYQGDIWPEFIEMAFGHLSRFAHILFTPVYKARIKNYSIASGITALSKNYLEFARSVAPNGHEKPYALVYNGIDVEHFEQMLTKEIPSEVEKAICKQSDEVLCIFAGTFGPSYDITAMIECAKLFDENDKHVKFVFAGSGPRVSEVTDAAKRQSNVVYLGALKPAELIPVYAICDIGLCPYTAKSNVDMPDKFYDYTAAGLAVVNSLTEEVAERIEAEQIGYNYEASNPIDLYEKIDSIVSKPELLKEMKSRSKKLGQEFDSNVQLSKLSKLIDKVLEERQ